MSIENIFKALEIVDSLSADDFDKFKKHLEVVDSKFAKPTGDYSGMEIPPYGPRPLRSVVETKPDYIPPLPPISRSVCTCSSFFGLIPTHPDKCKCRGGK